MTASAVASPPSSPRMSGTPDAPARSRRSATSCASSPSTRSAPTPSSPGSATARPGAARREHSRARRHHPAGPQGSRGVGCPHPVSAASGRAGWRAWRRCRAGSGTPWAEDAPARAGGEHPAGGPRRHRDGGVLPAPRRGLRVDPGQVAERSARTARPWPTPSGSCGCRPAISPSLRGHQRGPRQRSSPCPTTSTSLLAKVVEVGSACATERMVAAIVRPGGARGRRAQAR